MYLVQISRAGKTYLVLTGTDPRADGCPAPVTEGVPLDYDPDRVAEWGYGRTPPPPCVGRSADDPGHYKVFRAPLDLSAAGFELVPGTPVLCHRWAEFAAAGGPPNCAGAGAGRSGAATEAGRHRPLDPQEGPTARRAACRAGPDAGTDPGRSPAVRRVQRRHPAPAAVGADATPPASADRPEGRSVRRKVPKSADVLRCDACERETPAVGTGGDLPAGWESVVVAVSEDFDAGVDLCPGCCRDKAGAVERARGRWR